MTESFRAAQRITRTKPCVLSLLMRHGRRDPRILSAEPIDFYSGSFGDGDRARHPFMTELSELAVHNP